MSVPPKRKQPPSRAVDTGIKLPNLLNALHADASVSSLGKRKKVNGDVSAEEDVPPVQLREFDPYSMPDNATCFFIGKRGSGKTTLVANILKAKQHIPCGVAISATEEANAFWQRHIPGDFIHGKYNKVITSNLIAMQRQLASQTDDMSKLPPAFALYDDIMFNRSFPQDEETRELFMNGRHYKIFLMLTAQYCMDLPPGLRANIDFVFILQDHVQKNKERLFQCYAGVFPRYVDFLDVLERYTCDYGALVIDNTSRSNKVEDVIFCYTADPDPGEFHVGDAAYWAHGQNIIAKT